MLMSIHLLKIARRSSQVVLGPFDSQNNVKMEQVKPKIQFYDNDMTD